MLYTTNMLFAKKTKILATLGPATSKESILQELVSAGMNAARFNFSHGTQDDHKKRLDILRRIENDTGKPIAIVADLQGRKIRLGTLQQEVILQEGQEVVLYHSLEQIDTRIPVQINIFKDLKPGNHILINDGIVRLAVQEIFHDKARCQVLTGGKISSHKGINLPDAKLTGSALTQKDKDDLAFILPLGIEYVAISFVQDADDIIEAKKTIAQYTKETKVIAKIECNEAIRNLEEIIAVSDMVMIARGDMAVEISQEDVPIIQRKIIHLCRKRSVPVIVATQMLESMIFAKEPTRAEVSDVASAVFDMVDTVMLSAETASGKYPVYAVSMMDKIIQRIGAFFESESLEPTIGESYMNEEQTAAIANAATVLAKQLHAKCIATITESGHTAREVARYRSKVPIIAVTDDYKIYRQLILLWGVVPYYLEVIKSTEEAFKMITAWLEKEKMIRKHDRIVVITGSLPGVTGNTNTITVGMV